MRQNDPTTRCSPTPCQWTVKVRERTAPPPSNPQPRIAPSRTPFPDARSVLPDRTQPQLAQRSCPLHHRPPSRVAPSGVCRGPFGAWLQVCQRPGRGARGNGAGGNTGGTDRLPGARPVRPTRVDLRTLWDGFFRRISFRPGFGPHGRPAAAVTARRPESGYLPRAASRRESPHPGSWSFRPCRNSRNS